jgi:hypothetical protein
MVGKTTEWDAAYSGIPTDKKVRELIAMSEHCDQFAHFLSDSIYTDGEEERTSEHRQGDDTHLGLQHFTVKVKSCKTGHDYEVQQHNRKRPAKHQSTTYSNQRLMLLHSLQEKQHSISV